MSLYLGVSLVATHSQEVRLSSLPPLKWEGKGDFRMRAAKVSFPALTILGSNDVAVLAVSDSLKFAVWRIKDNIIQQVTEIELPTAPRPSIYAFPAVLAWEDYLGLAALVENGRKAALILSDYDQRNNQFLKRKEVPLSGQRHFPSLGRYRLDGVIPLDGRCESFLLLGSEWDQFLFYGPFLMPDPQSFMKNWTMLFSKGTNTPPRRVPPRPKGRWDVSHADYALDSSGLVYCTWLKAWGGELYCSVSERGSAWSRNLRVYPPQPSALSGPRFVVDASVAATSEFAQIVWVVDGEGVFAATVPGREYLAQSQKMVALKSPKTESHTPNKDPVIEPEQIGKWHEYDSMFIGEITSLAGVSFLDLAFDGERSFYAVWALQGEPATRGTELGTHRLAASVRAAGGRWSPEIVLSEGPGVIRVPSIAVSKDEVHLAYLRKTADDQFSCFYRRFPVSAMVSAKQ